MMMIPEAAGWLTEVIIGCSVGVSIMIIGGAVAVVRNINRVRAENRIQDERIDHNSQAIADNKKHGDMELKAIRQEAADDRNGIEKKFEAITKSLTDIAGTVGFIRGKLSGDHDDNSKP